MKPKRDALDDWRVSVCLRSESDPGTHRVMSIIAARVCVVCKFGASRKCACSSESLQLQIRRGSNATSCCRVWLEKLPTAQRFSLALTCSQHECQVVMPPKNSLVPDPQPGLDSDGRHWEYTIKLTCGHIACNADSAYKRREHLQKELSGKHRQVAPPLWQRRGFSP